MACRPSSASALRGSGGKEVQRSSSDRRLLFHCYSAVLQSVGQKEQLLLSRQPSRNNEVPAAAAAASASSRAKSTSTCPRIFDSSFSAEVATGATKGTAGLSAAGRGLRHAANEAVANTNAASTQDLLEARKENMQRVPIAVKSSPALRPPFFRTQQKPASSAHTARSKPPGRQHKNETQQAPAQTIVLPTLARAAGRATSPQAGAPSEAEMVSSRPGDTQEAGAAFSGPASPATGVAIARGTADVTTVPASSVDSTNAAARPGAAEDQSAIVKSPAPFGANAGSIDRRALDAANSTAAPCSLQQKVNCCMTKAESLSRRLASKAAEASGDPAAPPTAAADENANTAYRGVMLQAEAAAEALTAVGVGAASRDGVLVPPTGKVLITGAEASPAGAPASAAPLTRCASFSAMVHSEQQQQDGTRRRNARVQQLRSLSANNQQLSRTSQAPLLCNNRLPRRPSSFILRQHNSQPLQQQKHVERQGQQRRQLNEPHSQPEFPPGVSAAGQFPRLEVADFQRAVAPESRALTLKFVQEQHQQQLLRLSLRTDGACRERQEEHQKNERKNSGVRRLPVRRRQKMRHFNTFSFLRRHLSARQPAAAEAPQQSSKGFQKLKSAPLYLSLQPHRPKSRYKASHGKPITVVVNEGAVEAAPFSSSAPQEEVNLGVGRAGGTAAAAFSGPVPTAVLSKARAQVSAAGSLSQPSSQSSSVLSPTPVALPSVPASSPEAGADPRSVPLPPTLPAHEDGALHAASAPVDPPSPSRRGSLPGFVGGSFKMSSSVVQEHLQTPELARRQSLDATAAPDSANLCAPVQRVRTQVSDASADKDLLESSSSRSEVVADHGDVVGGEAAEASRFLPASSLSPKPEERLSQHKTNQDRKHRMKEEREKREKKKEKKKMVVEKKGDSEHNGNDEEQALQRGQRERQLLQSHHELQKPVRPLQQAPQQNKQVLQQQQKPQTHNQKQKSQQFEQQQEKSPLHQERHEQGNCHDGFLDPIEAPKPEENSILSSFSSLSSQPGGSSAFVRSCRSRRIDSSSSPEGRHKSSSSSSSEESEQGSPLRGPGVAGKSSILIASPASAVGATSYHSAASSFSFSSVTPACQRACFNGPPTAARCTSLSPSDTESSSSPWSLDADSVTVATTAGISRSTAACSAVSLPFARADQHSHQRTALSAAAEQRQQTTVCTNDKTQCKVYLLPCSHAAGAPHSVSLHMQHGTPAPVTRIAVRAAASSAAVIAPAAAYSSIPPPAEAPDEVLAVHCVKCCREFRRKGQGQPMHRHQPLHGQQQRRCSAPAVCFHRSAEFDSRCEEAVTGERTGARPSAFVLQHQSVYAQDLLPLKYQWKQQQLGRMQLMTRVQKPLTTIEHVGQHSVQQQPRDENQSLNPQYQQLLVHLQQPEPQLLLFQSERESETTSGRKNATERLSENIRLFPISRFRVAAATGVYAQAPTTKASLSKTPTIVGLSGGAARRVAVDVEDEEAAGATLAEESAATRRQSGASSLKKQHVATRVALTCQTEHANFHGSLDAAAASSSSPSSSSSSSFPCSSAGPSSAPSPANAYPGGKPNEKATLSRESTVTFTRNTDQLLLQLNKAHTEQQQSSYTSSSQEKHSLQPHFAMKDMQTVQHRNQQQQEQGCEQQSNQEKMQLELQSSITENITEPLFFCRSSTLPPHWQQQDAPAVTKETQRVVCSRDSNVIHCVPKRERVSLEEALLASDLLLRWREQQRALCSSAVAESAQPDPFSSPQEQQQMHEPQGQEQLQLQYESLHPMHAGDVGVEDDSEVTPLKRSTLICTARSFQASQSSISTAAPTLKTEAAAPAAVATPAAVSAASPPLCEKTPPPGGSVCSKRSCRLSRCRQPTVSASPRNSLAVASISAQQAARIHERETIALKRGQLAAQRAEERKSLSQMQTGTRSGSMTQKSSSPASERCRCSVSKSTLLQGIRTKSLAMANGIIFRHERNRRSAPGGSSGNRASQKLVNGASYFASRGSQLTASVLSSLSRSRASAASAATASAAKFSEKNSCSFRAESRSLHETSDSGSNHSKSSSDSDNSSSSSNSNKCSSSDNNKSSSSDSSILMMTSQHAAAKISVYPPFSAVKRFAPRASLAATYAGTAEEAVGTGWLVRDQPHSRCSSATLLLQSQSPAVALENRSSDATNPYVLLQPSTDMSSVTAGALPLFNIRRKDEQNAVAVAVCGSGTSSPARVTTVTTAGRAASASAKLPSSSTLSAHAFSASAASNPSSASRSLSAASPARGQPLLRAGGTTLPARTVTIEEGDARAAAETEREGSSSQGSSSPLPGYNGSSSGDAAGSSSTDSSGSSTSSTDDDETPQSSLRSESTDHHQASSSGVEFEDAAPDNRGNKGLSRQAAEGSTRGELRWRRGGPKQEERQAR